MANTYTLIEAKTLGSTVASVTFSAIPSTYTDLELLVSARLTGSSAPIDVRFNSNSSNYIYRSIFGTGSSVASYTGGITDRISLQYATGTDVTANTFASCKLYIPNYAGSNYKSASSDNTQENNATASVMTMITHLWSDTTAISSLYVFAGSNDFAINSTFYLYGIKNS
jgi:hypothetical protein